MIGGCLTPFDGNDTAASRLARFDLELHVAGRGAVHHLERGLQPPQVQHPPLLESEGIAGARIGLAGFSIDHLLHLAFEDTDLHIAIDNRLLLQIRAGGDIALAHELVRHVGEQRFQQVRVDALAQVFGKQLLPLLFGNQAVVTQANALQFNTWAGCLLFPGCRLGSGLFGGRHQTHQGQHCPSQPSNHNTPFSLSSDRNIPMSLLWLCIALQEM